MLAEHMARAEQQVAEPLDFASQYREHMRKLGAKGGKKGGMRRMQTMTPEQRSEVAAKAARKRWADVAAKKVGKAKR